MPEADSPAALVDDLKALSARERREVLAALSPFERAQVAALIEARSNPAPAPAASFSRYSLWLARHLQEVEDGGGGNLTPATRRVLAEAAAEPAVGGGDGPEGRDPKRRSLLDALAQRLSPVLR